MRTALTASPVDRSRLDALVRDRNAAQKHVWRARIVLLTADGLAVGEIMRRTSMSEARALAGALCARARGRPSSRHDAGSRVPPPRPEVAERAIALTLTAPTREATHGTAAMMAGDVGISVSSVQRIWRAHGLQPHRVRQFKLSNEPDFVEKLMDIRHLVTSLAAGSAEYIYDAFYCARGQAENPIKRDKPALELGLAYFAEQILLPGAARQAAQEPETAAGTIAETPGMSDDGDDDTAPPNRCRVTSPPVGAQNKSGT